MQKLNTLFVGKKCPSQQTINYRHDPVQALQLIHSLPEPKTIVFEDLSVLFPVMDMSWFSVLKYGLRYHIIAYSSEMLDQRILDLFDIVHVSMAPQSSIVQQQMDFSLVGGYTRQKQQLLRIRRLDRYRGTLLYGPPGNGKTLLAQTLAGELKIRLIKLSLDKLVKGYVGESEKQIKRHFEEARKQPTLLFIDEFESLFQRRETNDLATKAYAQLVYELDRTDNVHLICCTNHRHLIDPGLLQSGRIDNHVYIGNPTPEDRHAIFDKLLSSVHLQKNVDLDQLVVKSENQSVSYLKEWTRQASLLAVSENCILSNAHFDRLNSF